MGGAGGGGRGPGIDGVLERCGDLLGRSFESPRSSMADAFFFFFLGGGEEQGGMGYFLQASHVEIRSSFIIRRSCVACILYIRDIKPF